MSGNSSPGHTNRISSRISRFKNHISNAFSPTVFLRHPPSRQHSPSIEDDTRRLGAVPADPAKNSLYPASPSHHQPGSIGSFTDSVPVHSSRSSPAVQPSTSTHTWGKGKAPLLPHAGLLSKGKGMFNQSHGFSINGTNTFVDINATSDNFMKDLLQETIPGAGFDSSDRYPPPRCHPGTRLAIIQRCLDFIAQCSDEEKMRWVVGHAGVGKSAVMQIVAEEAPGVIVASIFFAVNDRKDGSKTFTTIAYQLAVKCEPYREFIRNEITRDPALFRRALPTQFNKFIVEPFIHHLYNYPCRFLILIDGIDECSNPLTQRELLELISGFCIQYPTSPVVWIIASRPEPIITLFFNKPEVALAYTKEEIVVDSYEGRRDVELYLGDELQKVKLTNPTLQYETEWPSKHDLLKITSASGGLFAYASIVVKYIDDPYYGDPASQLHGVLVAIDAGPKRDRSGRDHPLAPLDALYGRILSNVPRDVMVNTRKLLLPQRYWRWGANKFRLQCNLLGLTQHAAYGAVRHIQSVVKVPIPGEADKKSFKFFHKSFDDYLSDFERSGFSPDVQQEANELMAQISLRVAEEVLDGSGDMDGGEVIECRDYGYLKVGPGTGCDNITLSWPGDERFERTDDEIKVELYRSAITAISDRFAHRQKAFLNTSCFRVLTRCFTAPRIYFPFYKLLDFAFDDFRDELAKLGILKQVSLKTLDYAAICGRIELQFLSPIRTNAGISHPWNPFCKHKKSAVHRSREWQGWKTTFGRYEEDIGSNQDPEDALLVDIPRFNIVAGYKFHWQCLSETRWNVEECHLCLRCLFLRFINYPDQLATVFFDSTGLCYVELAFVDPDDGVSQWRYRFLHSGLPSGPATSVVPKEAPLGLLANLSLSSSAGPRRLARPPPAPRPLTLSSPLPPASQLPLPFDDMPTSADTSPFFNAPPAMNAPACYQSGSLPSPSSIAHSPSSSTGSSTSEVDFCYRLDSPPLLINHVAMAISTGSFDSPPCDYPLQSRRADSMISIDISPAYDWSSDHSTTGQGVGTIGPPVGTNQGFPDDLDIHAMPSDLKKEGTNWSAVFNPKVERQLDVSLVHTLMHESAVCCVRFSADGKYLATGCNQTALIYDANTGEKICVLVDEAAGQTGRVYIRSVCFSPDGKFLATGAEDKKIRVWDIGKKRIRNVFDGHEQEICALEFTTDGSLLVSGSYDATVRIWDMVDGTSKVLTIDDRDPLERDSGVTSVAISPDGDYVAAGSLDAVVQIWDVASEELVERLRGHMDSVYSVAFTPDGKGLVSASLDKTLKYWDISALDDGDGEGPSAALEEGGTGDDVGSPCMMNFIGHKDYVLSVAVSPDGQWIFSGSKDRSVQIWDAKNAKLQCMLQGHQSSVMSIDLSPAGSILATGSGDGEARIWSYNPV